MQRRSSPIIQSLDDRDGAEALNIQASAAPLESDAAVETGKSSQSIPARMAWAALFLAAYLGFEQISSIGPAPPLVLTPWNPALGLCVAAVMQWRGRILPFVFTAPILTNIIISDLPATSTMYAVWIGLMGVAETLAVTACARRLSRAVPNPLLKNKLAAVLLSCFPITLVFAVLHVAVLEHMEMLAGAQSSAQLIEAVTRIWVGHVIGIFIVTPLCCLVLSLRRPRTISINMALQIAAQAVLVAGAVWLAFGENPTRASRYFYIVFLPMIWIVLRWGMNGAIIMNAFVQISMVVSLSWAGHDSVDVTLFQAFLLVMAASSFTLGLAVDQSRASAQQLRAREGELAASLKIAATGELAGTLAHELGHPLGAISNYASALDHVIAKVAPDSIEAAGISRKLSREIKRATDTLHRLRDFFRTGSLAVERVDMGALVREAVGLLHDRLETKAISPSITIQGGSNVVLADRVQIHAVIHNVLINAVDALRLAPPEDRMMAITVSRTPDGVTLEIDDSGVGVAADVRDHIFEPLTTTKKDGLGLGLSMSRSVVAAHGGRIHLDESRLGGARFVISLPFEPPKK